MKIHPKLRDFDPREYGFRCGLEVHHQIKTDKKLFCRCPAGLYSDEYDAQVLRHMRPTLSELGEYDGTALMEFKTKKEIIYRLNKKSVCTYEMDDNPPFLINRQAVDIAIEIALMLNCSIVGELHVSRKQYLDGSIPAGFQRTAIIGVNGWLPYKDRKIGIIQLALEEDACREVSDIGHRRVYTTDRLSMPLIEVVTAPDMLSPDEVYEVGVLIGRLLRMSGKVRRGIGSVRQDVNVSVTGGKRIEIKGVPRLPVIPRAVHCEAYRQHKLLEIRSELTRRGIDADNLETERFDLTGRFKSDLITPVDDNTRVGAVKICGFRGILTAHIGPERTFAHDVAGRVRVIACMNSSPVILHTDESEAFQPAAGEADLLKELTGETPDDVTVAVWGNASDVKTALNEVEIRCREAASIIPDETRQLLDNGETDFERILPGPDRMYPDTDSPPLALSPNEVDRIREGCRERPWERNARLKALGLSQHLVDMMLLSPRIDLFDRLTGEKRVDPVVAAVTLGELLVHTRRLSGNLVNPEDADLENLFDLYSAGRISREAFRMLLEDSALTGSFDWQALLYLREPPVLNSKNKKSIIKKIIKGKTAESPVGLEPRIKFLMGEVMTKLRGVIPGREISEIVTAELQ